MLLSQIMCLTIWVRGLEQTAADADCRSLSRWQHPPWALALASVFRFVYCNTCVLLH
jgi:hypothetical protein